MTDMQFTKATKTQSKARIGLIGPSGSGKTYTALLLAAAFGQRIALIDTENASASKYAGAPGIPEFDVLALETFSPSTYVEAIHAAEAAGYDVLVIDSLSHAWAGKGGALEMVDAATKRSKKENKFAAWRDVTPHHNSLVDALVRCKCHLIATMRSKTDYVLQPDENGKMVPKKVGMAPIQREGLEYEFDVAGDMDIDHNLLITKTRCPALDGAVIHKPGKDLAGVVKAWLSDGVQPAPIAARPASTETSAQKPTATNGNGVHKATAADFWDAAKKAGLDRETSLNILKERGGDLASALEAVKAQTPPEIPF